MATTPVSSDPRSKSSGPSQLLQRLEQCWGHGLNWDLYPNSLREGCKQVGKALSMPAVAVLAGLILIVSYSISHSVVAVEGTDWIEPVLVWLSICMPTGSGKSSLCRYLRKLVEDARTNCGLDENQPSWFLDDQSFEKMGALMCDNHWKLLGLFDELPMFLSQMNVFRGRGLSDSHELAILLQLYGGSHWVRKTVSGDANFTMKYTGLTVGGFTQPSVARALIELQTNTEKGFTQRFLWCAPRPQVVKFEELQKVDAEFSASIVGLMASMWVNSPHVRTWTLPRSSLAFKTKFDNIQGQLQQVSCMDDLLSGMLSKSKGQLLRVAVSLHVLFNRDNPLDISQSISEEAVRAAENFVDLCLQHAAYLAGRGDIQEAILAMQPGNQCGSQHRDGQAHANAAFSLLLPGQVLHLNALLAMKKFRDRGNKDGAVRGFILLQEAGLGKVIERKPQRGTSVMYEFQKASIPEDVEMKMDFAEKLMSFGISLQQYQNAVGMDEVTMSSLESRKRALAGVRTSPRKKLTSSFPEDIHD